MAPNKTKIKIKTALLLSSGLVFLIFSGVIGYLVKDNLQKLSLEAARQDANLLLTHNLAIHSYFGEKLKPAILPMIEDQLATGYFDPAWMSSTFAVRQIQQTSESILQRDYYYKECAINARSAENEADEIESNFLVRLNNNPELQEETTVREINGITSFVTMRRGETMLQSCLLCHSTPEVAPKGLVRLYGDQRSFHRNVGETISAVSIRIPLTQAYATATTFSWWLSGALILAAALLMAIKYQIYNRLLLKPIMVIRDQANRIAVKEGCLGETLPSMSGRELDGLAAAFNVMSGNLKKNSELLEHRVEERTAELGKALKDLQKSENRYRSLNRSMIQAMALHEVICDKDGTPIDYRFLDVNPAFEKLLGRSAGEIVGKTARQILPDTEATWIETYGQVVLSGEPIHFENYSQELDRYFDVVAYCPLEGQFAVVVTDITKNKKAETELQKIEKLEGIGTLAGGIAHDFNNVLTGLYGNLALLKMKLANDHPGFRFLEAAEQSMLRTTLLTNRLLTFAKGGDPVTKSLSLVSLIEEVVNLSLSGSNVKPAITSADNLWQVRVDQRQIEQVFANLTVNAREAMPDGGHLYITMENAELAENTLQSLAGGKYLRITVTDEGTGIEHKLLDKIFDPYFTTKEMGSGLGLASAYSIIDKHAGHISVTSQLGKGTTFTLYLPGTEVVEETSLTQPGATQVPLTQGAKILVMDDEEMIRNMLNEMLGELGFAVETAVEGQQAIDMYRQTMDTGTPFAIVILDLTIPGGVGGQKAAKGILQIDPGAKIIVSSGYADDPLTANYADYGFMGVATKPYSMNKLSGVLAQVMETG